MRHGAGGRRPGTLLRQILPGGHVVHPVRRGGGLPLSLGGPLPRTEDVRLLGDAGVHRHRAGGLLLYLEEGSAGLVGGQAHPAGHGCSSRAALDARARQPGSGVHPGSGRGQVANMTPAITDLEQLKEREEVASLLAWKPAAGAGARFDRDELSVWIERGSLREACAILRDHPQLQYDFLADLTCVDWYPAEPRFEVVYHLLSIARKARLRLKVRLGSEEPRLESVTSVWPAANFFEREVFDLFGVYFEGHPYLRRILMPEAWEGHPRGAAPGAGDRGRERAAPHARYRLPAHRDREDLRGQVLPAGGAADRPHRLSLPPDQQ